MIHGRMNRWSRGMPRKMDRDAGGKLCQHADERVSETKYEEKV